MSLKTLFVGPIYHCKSVELIHSLAVLGVDWAGKIALFESISSIDDVDFMTSAFDTSACQRISLKSGQFIIPGFVDTHIHGPQYVFTGTGYDLTLLRWLETYTFPREAAFASPKVANDVYSKVVRRTLTCGTTTACYYATIDLESSKILAHWVHQYGQRAYVGKVNMDRNSPDYYIESTADSISSTRAFIDYIQNDLKSDRITPILTPRFVPSCTPELMKALGSLSHEFNLPIQSHLSETPGEIEWVQQLHPEAKSYSAVYDSFGLLHSRSVMAHCVHLSQEERDLLRLRKVGVSHCASSNFCLHSGVLNTRRLLMEGHDKVGLGTDVAGGYSSSIMDAMRQSIIASKVVHVASRESARNASDEVVYAPLSFVEVFYMATLGGAKVLNLDHLIGNFVVGKDFDALLVDLDGLDLFEETPSSLFEKFIYLGDDRHIKQVYVAGERVKNL